QHFPASRVVLADLAPVIAVSDYPDVLPMDFFNPWPMQADRILLARVLHDWPDEKAIQILRLARQALLSAGQILIVEMICEDSSPSGALCDLHLLAVT